MGSGKACGQLERACPSSKHSNSQSLKTRCSPSKMLPCLLVICPLAQPVTSDSSPAHSKRSCLQHSHGGNEHGAAWVRRELAGPEQTPDSRSLLITAFLLRTRIGHRIITSQLWGVRLEGHIYRQAREGEAERDPKPHEDGRSGFSSDFEGPIPVWARSSSLAALACLQGHAHCTL